MVLQQSLKLILEILSKVWDNNTFKREILILISKGSNKPIFFRFFRYVNIVLNQRSNLFWTVQPEPFVWYFDSQI